MTQKLYYLTDDPTWFPEPKSALEHPSGLLAIGGDLSFERVYNAYQNGIFPWFNEDEPVLWWCPDPRALIEIGQVRVNKTLRKFLKKCDYRVSINQCFKKVIEHCAEPRAYSEGTWILPEMVECYDQLHQKGYAHSIEVWQGDDLVGGLYGVTVGSCFCGESMFSKQPNASKLALIVLQGILQDVPNAFIDCQLQNAYLMSMGASLVSRDIYLEKLEDASEIALPKSVFSPKFIEWQAILNFNDYG